MAGGPVQPARHGKGWRVRWRHPDRSLPPSERDQQMTVWSLNEGRALAAWLYELEPPNSAFAHEPRVRYGVWAGRTIVEEGRYTFGSYATQFVMAKDSLPRTKLAYLRDLKKHVADWWDLPLDSIDREMLEEKIRQLKTTPRVRGTDKEPVTLALKTQATYIAKIAGVFAAAVREGKITRTPFAADTDKSKPKIKIKDFNKIPRRRKNDEIYIPFDEWLKILRAAADLDLQRSRDVWITEADRHLHERQTVDMLWLLAETGCRISEIHGLLVRHGKAAQRNGILPIEVQRQYDEHMRPQEALPKGGEVGEVVIASKELLARLQTYVEGRDINASLFPAPKRGDAGWLYSSWWDGRWSKVLELARSRYHLAEILNPVPHSIRHCNLTWLRDAGLDLADLVVAGRWKDSKMFEAVYGRQTAAQVERIRNAKANFPRPA